MNSTLIQYLGEACFALESDSNNQLPVHDTCPVCSPPVKLDNKRPPDVLNHMGAHILFNTPDRSVEPCGLCLAPWPHCLFTIGLKGKGQDRSLQVTKIQGCRNPLKFKYGTAATSTKKSPCSNVPIQCPKCLTTDPAIWRYNLLYHFLRVHPDVSLDKFEHLWKLSPLETQGMHTKWRKRNSPPSAEKGKKKKGKNIPLKISAAHSSRLALRSVIVAIILFQF
ncbi:hypothetical protein C8J56DRAFT_799849 [Mycena floridula]|nr:hypothetical protein C8J56DRAFT_799849 [Mycena floridula]